MMFLLLILFGILQFTTLPKILDYLFLVLATALESTGICKRF